ncbi:hypothetical protein N5P37_009791 [Trichoderma harzianum]|nr:hypothetical protein N5P37_009791 [Trichoderma harzianum]
MSPELRDMEFIYTISEPEPEQQSSQSGRPLSRSCYTCNRRKIRCDKQEPCTPCSQAGKPCAYPPRRIRRAKHTIMADMASRISSLEKALAKANSKDLSALGISVSKNSSSSSSAQPVRLRGDDVLVEKGSSSQYFNEVMLSRVIEEERDIESVLSTSHTGTPHQPATSPFNPAGILSSLSLLQEPHTFHPTQPLAVRLWNNYVENVDGCSGLIKLLHLPTDRVKVYSVIHDPASASFHDLAFCFAIYFASAVSFEDVEARLFLGQDKDDALNTFKTGLEQAFAHGDFLDRPTLTGLLALVIYLSGLRVHNRGKGIWILNGLTIRIAQSLGLHRDGLRLGLPPFQSEMRRRLWWHLLSRDSRSGEDYGLENTSGQLLGSNVSLPLNVDDVDLSPDMKELPKPKNSWTAMTFSLINIELAKSIHKLADIAATSSLSSPPTEDIRIKVIDDLSASIEGYLQNCNPVIPQHRMTLLCSRFLVRKLNFTTRLQWSFLRRTMKSDEFATEENLVEALELLEPRLFNDDGLLKQFSWARRAYPQYHITMYVLWHLCVKPEGPSVDRAWRALDIHFSEVLCDKSTIGFGSKSAVLTALKAKALSIRAKHRGTNPRENRANTEGSSALTLHEGVSENNGLPSFLFGNIVGADSLEFDIDKGEWLDWTTLPRGSQGDSPAESFA